MGVLINAEACSKVISMNNTQRNRGLGRVQDKVAIVTGGGSGIGRAVSVLLAEQGASVLVTDINAIAAEATAETIMKSSGNALGLKHDVTNEMDWAEVINMARETYGGLDVLVNNAGIGIDGECRYTKQSDWQAVINVNLNGTFLGVRAAINAMVDDSRPKHAVASIINISSAYGLVGGGLASYSASKGGVTLLTKAVAAECAEQGYNIRINSLHPGGVDTPMANLHSDQLAEQAALQAYYAKVPMGRCAEPSEIAQGVLFLASDESSYMTGSELIIDGGYTAV